jgi:uncharacterized membrane protein
MTASRSLRALAPLLLAAPGAFAQSFHGLGTLNGQDSEATAVSADGQVVVGWSSVAFRWTAPTGMVQIGPPNENSIAQAVSADGSVVVGYYEPSNLESFRWTQATGPVPMGMASFVDTAAPFNCAYAVSGDGQAIVGTSSSNSPSNTNEAYPGRARSACASSTGVTPRGSTLRGMPRTPTAR